MASINDFKSRLTGGGARPNLFRVICNFPAVAGVQGGLGEKASFLIKGAQLPTSVISPITLSWRGRQAKFAGDRTFEPWNITVLNDTTFDVRNAFERWSNAINNHTTNAGSSTPVEYEADMIVEQLDKAENVIKSYTFRGTWPSSIGPIELSTDTENTIEEFTVELQVTFWESGTTS